MLFLKRFILSFFVLLFLFIIKFPVEKVFAQCYSNADCPHGGEVCIIPEDNPDGGYCECQGSVSYEYPDPCVGCNTAQPYAACTGYAYYPIGPSYFASRCDYLCVTPTPPPTCEEAGYTCTPSCDPGNIVGYFCSSGGFCCTVAGGPSPTPGGPTPTPNPSLPSIISLVVKNPSPTPVFQGLFGFSGNMTTQSGLGWFNPMEITVNARPSTGNFLIGYVLAFYSGAKLENPSTFLTDIENRLNPYVGGNPKNGFLFYYDPILGNFYIWDKTEFKPMPSNHQVKDTSGNLLMTGYKVGASSIFANPGYATWKITLDKNFDSKTMYTAVIVIDTSIQVDFKSNITPQNN